MCNRWKVQAPQNIWPAATFLVVEKGDAISSAHQRDVAMVVVHARVVGHLAVPPTGPGDMTFGSVIASIVIQEWHQVRARVQGLDERREGEIVEHLDGLENVCLRIDNVPDVQYRKVTNGLIILNVIQRRPGLIADRALVLMRMLVCSRTRQVLAVPVSNAVVFTNFYALDQTALRLRQHPLDSREGWHGVRP